MIELSESLREYFKDTDVFEALCSLPGRVYREKDGRKTFRTEINGKPYFIKLYRGIGWISLLGSLLRFRLPVLSAKNEWKAIRRLEALGIETLRLAGCGKRRWSPAAAKSFVITEELTPTISLENFCRNWPSSPPNRMLKRALITKAAHIAKKLHENDLIHRDFYICHFLLDKTFKKEKIDIEDLHLYLIDLHRMGKRYFFSKRGRMKDVAALYFSCMDIGLTQSDLFRFIRIYRGMPLKTALRDKRFWRRVNRRARGLYRKAHGRNPTADRIRVNSKF